MNLDKGESIPAKGVGDPLLLPEDEQHDRRRGWGSVHEVCGGTATIAPSDLTVPERARRCELSGDSTDFWSDEDRHVPVLICGADATANTGAVLSRNAIRFEWHLALAAAMSALRGPLAAQGPAGHLEERVTAASDTSQSYSLYLPPGYTTTRTWPILFVLDPRGRALLAEKLFEDAAARLGWVVMSSYNTLSDGPVEPNVKAMNAMLAAAQRLAIDSTRRYLAGFSGSARIGLHFAVQLRGQVAGVIVAGGAVGFEMGGPETAFAADSTFAVFGAAGTRDFNYEEVLAFGERLRTTRVPYRVAVFDGPHSWPPAALCADALEWLELRAI